MKLFTKLSAIFLFSIILLTSTVLYADVKYETTGQVKDKNSNEPLLYCTISVYSVKDSLITGAITDDNGFFNLPLEKGNYKLLFSYTGYRPDTLKVDVKGENLFLGIIKLEPNEKQLGEVKVVSKANENRIDKEVQLVTKHLREGAVITSDVLGKMQGITYDRYNKSIKVDGSDKVILLVNNMEKDQDYIKNLAPDKIKEIEIIRNPSGRYALEGYTAVVNIVLKTDYNGTEFYISDDTYFDLDTKKSSYLIPINYASATYNYTYNKLNFYAKYRSYMNDFNLMNRISKTYKDGISEEQNPRTDNENVRTAYKESTYTLGFDYYLNPKHTFSFESKSQTMPYTSTTANESYLITQLQNGATNTYETRRLNKSNSQNFNNSLFHIFRINENNKISSDFSITKYTDSYTTSYAETGLAQYTQDGTNMRNSTKFNTELDHKFNENASIIIGYGNSWRKIGYDFNSGSEPTGSFSTLDMRHKAYAYFSSKISKKISYKFGAAAEYSNPKAGDYQITYMIYQPHADLKFDLHQYLSIKFKYRTKSEYPTVDQALPFSRINDKYTSEKGNPYLKPENTHNLSMNISAVMGLLTLEPYYSFSNNKIIRAVEPLINGKYEFSYYNAEKFKNKGLKGNLTIPLFKQTFIIQSGFDYHDGTITHNQIDNNVSDWKMNSQMIYIDNKHDMLFLLMYQKNMDKEITGQGYTMQDVDFWLLYVQKTFFNKKLTASVAYLLPTDFGLNHTQVQYTKAGEYEEKSSADLNFIKNILQVSIKYRFSTGKEVKKSDKDVQEDVEKKGKGLF